MDGFHLANVALAALGRADRKGAIDTFDGAGYTALLTRLRAAGPDTVWAPTYDRSIEESVAGAIAVPAGTEVVVTEGNYLLVDDGPWSAVRRLLDEVWAVDVDPERAPGPARRPPRRVRQAARAGRGLGRVGRRAQRDVRPLHLRPRRPGRPGDLSRPPTPARARRRIRCGACRRRGSGRSWPAVSRAVSHDVDDLTSGFWVVVVTFEGELTAVRMDEVRRGPDATPGHRLATGVPRWPALAGAWRTSLDRAAYLEGVAEVRRRIAAGTVYQVNLCRVMEHDLPEDAADRRPGCPPRAPATPRPTPRPSTCPRPGSSSPVPHPRPTWCAVATG